MRIGFIVLTLLLSSGLFGQKAADSLNIHTVDYKLDERIGQQIVLVGTAVNAKLGAMVITEAGTIWIDGRDSWPKGYYTGEGTGKQLKVTGTLIEKYDLPVFIQKEGELSQAGIPLPEGSDLKEASHRYLLKNAKWKILSD